MQKSLTVLLTAVLVVFSACLISAQESNSGITIDRLGGKQANPTLVFKGVDGDRALSEQVSRDLRNCDWFDVRQPGSGVSDYIVTGVATENTLTLTLTNGAGRKIGDFQYVSNSARKRSAVCVDAILHKLFDVPGICNSKIVFSVKIGNAREIYVCDFDGRNPTRITANGAISTSPLWSPDAKTIVYNYTGTGISNVIQYRLDNCQSRRLTRYRGSNQGGAISPDGKYVALILSRSQQVDLYIRPTEGGQLIRLTNNVEVESSPCWSPDGQWIYFVSGLNIRPQIFRVSPFGKRMQSKVPGLLGSEQHTPKFSADGKLIYTAKIGGSFCIAMADVSNNSDVTSEKIVTANETEIRGEGPSWAPDRRHIVVADGKALYMVDTRHGTRRLLLSGGQMSMPDWSPILP